MASVDARLLKSLEGRRYSLPPSLLTFEQSDNHLPAARQGGEGYAVPVCVDRERQVLKTLHLPTPERRRRMSFLTALQLQRTRPVFAAAPATVVRGVLDAADVGAVELDGYLAARVDGKTWETLVQEDWSPAPALRLRLAAQLVCAVALLERISMAHGDLSGGNVMIAAAHADASVRLIDFDGFAHPQVPPIPVSRSRGGRGFGSDGYRHATYSTMDESVVVRSDRVAMAALAFELVTLNSADLEPLGRGTLLDQQELDQFTASAPAAVIGRFPAGWSLLLRAVSAQSPELAPAPNEWLGAIAQQSATRSIPSITRIPTVIAGPPLPIRILRPGGEELRVNLTRSENGFGSIDSRLAWLSYQRRAERLVLHGLAPVPMEQCRAGSWRMHEGEITLEVRAGDVLRCAAFEITIG